MSSSELWVSCRQLNGLRQQSKLADEAAAEAAASFAQLQKRNDDLSQKLQDAEQKHNNAVLKAAADTHRQQLLVSAMHKPNTMKQLSCLITACGQSHILALHKQGTMRSWGCLDVATFMLLQS